ncbi:MAG: CdvA-like protein [Candidatus Bathyarchaeota archaeon]|nr:CdvA-like protein [Candidatus Bathyarchaeota archaeon]
MSQPTSNLFLSIGKPVKDEYGRLVGRIISFATSPSGKFESVFIEQSDGRFTKQPMEYLVFNGAEITFISKIKSKAAVFCDQIPFIWRKDKALKDLAEKRKISQVLYQELHTNFTTVLSQLRKDAQLLIDEVAQSIKRCEEDLTALSYGVLHLELEHEIGKVSDDVYRTAFSQLQETMKRTSAEKTDMESVKTKLSNILLGDTPPAPELKPQQPEPQKMPEQKSKVYAETVREPEPETSELPEPPVVVYVKEVGKAGI